MEKFKILSDIIKKRRSIFPPSFEKREIEDETIIKILENANCAPSHRKTEPWRYKIFKGDALVKLADFLSDQYKKNTPADLFSEFKYNKTRKKVLISPCIIAICMQRDPKESVPEWEELCAVACSVQNLWLSSSALGIGGYWSSPKSIENMGELISLNPGEKCIGIFYMGYTENGAFESDQIGPISQKLDWIE